MNVVTARNICSALQWDNLNPIDCGAFKQLIKQDKNKAVYVMPDKSFDFGYSIFLFKINATFYSTMKYQGPIIYYSFCL